MKLRLEWISGCAVVILVLLLSAVAWYAHSVLVEIATIRRLNTFSEHLDAAKGQLSKAYLKAEAYRLTGATSLLNEYRSSIENSIATIAQLQTGGAYDRISLKNLEDLKRQIQGEETRISKLGSDDIGDSQRGNRAIVAPSGERPVGSETSLERMHVIAQDQLEARLSRSHKLLVIGEGISILILLLCVSGAVVFLKKAEFYVRERVETQYLLADTIRKLERKN